MVSPDNTIAFNGTVGGGGIELRSVNAQANVITANSIHDNSFPGISYSFATWASVATPTVPIILGFDLASGTIEGLTCPGCTAEIFSTVGADGEIYEGTVIGDQYGGFSFAKGHAFEGPALTATSRSSSGNTSEFSIPTFGPFQSAGLQPGNDLPRAMIPNKTLSERINSRIGAPWDGVSLSHSPLTCPAPQEDGIFIEVSNVGLTWVRLSNDHLEFKSGREGWDFSHFEISPCLDALISLLAEKNVTIVFTIVYWDENLGPYRPPDYGNEDEVNLYLDYTRYLVRHFSDRIRYFEILNEGSH